MTQTDAAGPIKNLLVESFERSLDYDRDLQDGAAAYQSGDFERYIAKVFDDALRSNEAATKAKRAVPGGLQQAARRRAAGRPSATTSDHAPPRSDRRRAARRRPGRGLLGATSAPTTQTAAPPATVDRRPAALRGRAQRPARPRGRRGQRGGRHGPDVDPAPRPPAAARPPPRARAIVQRPIPFGAKRRDEMRAYARRHYGLDSFRLQRPKVIVEHYTVDRHFQLGLRHLRPRRARRRAARAARHVRALRRRQGRDDLPARGADHHVPPHGRPQRHRDRDRAGRAQRAGDPRPARRSSAPSCA